MKLVSIKSGPRSNSAKLNLGQIVRKSASNTFQTGPNATDDDLGAIQTTVGNATGKNQTLALPRLT